jgi:transcriptional regulator with XRE-family HTH domain
MTQAELARELGVSKAYISMVLSGKKKPSARVAERLKEVNNLVNREANPQLKIRWASACAGSNPALGTPFSPPLSGTFRQFVVLL